MKISEATSVQEAVNIAKGLELTIPKRPTKPLSKIGFTSSEHRQYADKLEEYEKDIEKYNSEYNKFRSHRRDLDNQLVKFIRDYSGLDNTVPEEYAGKVYAYAYQQGHSGGFQEVYNILVDLVDIFE